MHGIAAVVELGYEYEFTLGGWMLSKIMNKLVERRNTVVYEIAATTYYILNMAQEIWGRSRGGSVEPPKLIFTNVSKRAVSDEKLRTNH